MPEATYLFPEGFLWGTATAAHQVEGGNTNNNWAAWENEPGRIYQGQKAGPGLRLAGRPLARRPGQRCEGWAERAPFLS